MIVALTGCTTPMQQPSPQPIPVPPNSIPPATTPSKSTQQPKSAPLPTQAPASTRMKAHPHFAPPPGVNSYWDTQLGVYVLDNVPNLYYRERTYYRWDNGWTWATYANGPWKQTDSSGIPPGLNRLHP
ncbi:hypothetical protein [Pseudomonas sp. TE3786]